MWTNRKFVLNSTCIPSMLDWQSPIHFLPGKQFQTFNVHQLLHLPEVVKDLGPLWSNSCFPFEDYNGDLRELFHGTKNVDGQVCFHIMFML